MRVDRHHEEHREQRREEAAGPPVPEPLQPDPAVLLPVGQQQARDQVPADHEEDVDAEEATRDPLLVAVVQQDGDDRDRAEAIERGDVPETRRGAGTAGSRLGPVLPLRTFSHRRARDCRSWHMSWRGGSRS